MPSAPDWNAMAMLGMSLCQTVSLIGERLTCFHNAHSGFRSACHVSFRNVFRQFILVLGLVYEKSVTAVELANKKNKPRVQKLQSSLNILFPSPSSRLWRSFYPGAIAIKT